METIDIYRACATLLTTEDNRSLESRLALEVLAIAARTGALQSAMRSLAGAPERALALL